MVKIASPFSFETYTQTHTRVILIQFLSCHIFLFIFIYVAYRGVNLCVYNVFTWVK